MVRNCCIHGCKNVWSPVQDIHYHCFPLSNPQLLNKWIKAIGVENFVPNKHTSICSQHFTEDSYSESCLMYKRLKKNAVPTIFNYQSNKRPKLLLKRSNTTETIIIEITPEDNNNNDGDVNDVPVNTREVGTQTYEKKVNITNEMIRQRNRRRTIKVLQQRLKRKDVKIETMKNIISVLKQSKEVPSNNFPTGIPKETEGEAVPKLSGSEQS